MTPGLSFTQNTLALASSYSHITLLIGSLKLGTVSSAATVVMINKQNLQILPEKSSGISEDLLL